MSLAAKRYASAFYDVALAADAWEKILKDMKQLSQWGTHPEFSRFCGNVLLPADLKHKIVLELSTAAQFHPLTQSFLYVVIDHYRLPLLQLMITEVLKMHFEKSNCLIADITSGYHLSDEVVSGLDQMLTERFKKKIFINQKLNPGVIGGVCIRVGSYLYDATLKHQLTQLSNNLKEA